MEGRDGRREGGRGERLDIVVLLLVGLFSQDDLVLVTSVPVPDTHLTDPSLLLGWCTDSRAVREPAMHKRVGIIE